MATITQHNLILDSQNQLRNADKLARDWAIAHAGAYQGQARKDLGGSALYREWSRDNLDIRIATPASAAVKQGQIVSIRYRPGADAEPYTAYLMTCGYSDPEPAVGCCIALISMPDALAGGELPWDDKAGPSGLDTLLQAINAGRAAAGSNGAGAGPGINSIADLFGQHDSSIVLTEDGQREQELRDLAAGHGDWAAVSSITAADQITIARELPPTQLADWLSAKIALFSRYADQNDSRLRLLAADGAQAAPLLDAERRRIVDNIGNRNCLLLLELLEAVADRQTSAMMADARSAINRLAEKAAESEAGGGAADGADSTATQQRIYLLEDQLEEATAAVADLRERLAQYESYGPGAQWGVNGNPASADGDDAADEPDNRELAVMEAMTNPERFPKLRFLTNCAKSLADFGKQRPTGGEIVAALDAINTLAQAWHNTPSGAVGNWDNYFINLKPGWTHANSESEFTMSRFGDKRSFSDQDHGRKVTIRRHLTYRGSNSGLQIYFDRDDVTDKFIVGYIGEHLPYATNRS